MHRRTVRLTLGAAAVAATLSLSACGSDHPAGHSDNPAAAPSGTSSGMSTGAATRPPEAADHNAADVAFATDMIPHHEQAVAMAALVEGRTQDGAVTALAGAITQAQDPEIATMSGWLRQWGQPVPAADAVHDMAGMDHGSGSSMEGMMTPEEMDRLEAASGAEFEKLWLEMMVRHHEGAVAMAQTVATEGESAEVRTLASEITASQTAEVETMRGLLAGRSG